MAPAPVQAASFDVVYNLSEGPEGLYLPTAYIVSRDREGLLSHIQQKAVSETIQHFKIELDEVRKTTFKLIEEVQVKALESRFSPPKKKEKPLEELMQDPEIQKAIFEFVHR
ncbi:MAG: ATP-dependent helicase, partial [Haliscomenobacter sp.]